MPYLYKERERPASWKDFQPKPLHPYLLPLSYTNWAGEWMAYILGKWSIFEVLEYVGSFSILVGVIFYFASAGDRLKMKDSQAWQVINTAQGKGGSGGRIDALQELNEDGVSLVGVDISDASLEGLRLVGADLHNGYFDRTDLMHSSLQRCDLRWGTFHVANLRNADLRSANLADARFIDADLAGADLRGADVEDVVFDRANLNGVDFGDVHNWQSIKSIKLANVHGVCNADDFVKWAIAQGARDFASDDDFQKWLDDHPASEASP
jgi:hypothetical protein